MEDCPGLSSAQVEKVNFLGDNSLYGLLSACFIAIESFLVQNRWLPCHRRLLLA